MFAPTTEPLCREMQRELAERSTNGELIIAEESGHNIHLEQPQVVIDAISQVVEATRRYSTRASNDNR